MATWIVTFRNGPKVSERVTADSSFSEADGRLRFFNRATDQKRSETVAEFAADQWAYYNQTPEEGTN
jgi:hypothetical protein